MTMWALKQRPIHLVYHRHPLGPKRPRRGQPAAVVEALAVVQVLRRDLQVDANVLGDAV